MAPVPVILLFPFVCLDKGVILLTVFFEIPPVRLIFSVIPLMRIVVSPIFVACDLLLVVSTVVTILCLGRNGKNQGRTQESQFEITIHRILLTAHLQQSGHFVRLAVTAEFFRVFCYLWLISRVATLRLNSADRFRGTLSDCHLSCAKCLASITICPTCCA